ncbi:MAG: PIN domain-containing protein [Oscillospiraceae bacterium]|jgi:predicted nucleic acid-binding protein|nr:PIN domain-containing protein [Oscillospiraceae bacterium]
MRKKKIYLDTSVISYLRQDDTPVQMAETQQLWDLIKLGEYDVFISDVMITELSNCIEPKRSELLALINDIEYTLIEVDGNEEIALLEKEIKSLSILPAKKIFDRLHIAAAIYCSCNIIVSWNFGHMVNVKTIDGVRILCLSNNISPIDIYSPPVLLERSISDD